MSADHYEDIKEIPHSKMHLEIECSTSENDLAFQDEQIGVIGKILRLTSSETISKFLKSGNFLEASKVLMKEVLRVPSGLQFCLYSLGDQLKEEEKFLEAILLYLFYLNHCEEHRLESNLPDLIAVSCEKISFVARRIVLSSPQDVAVLEDYIIPLMFEMKERIKLHDFGESRFIYEAYCFRYIANVHFFLKNYRKQAECLERGKKLLEEQLGSNCDDHRIYLILEQDRKMFSDNFLDKSCKV